MYLDSSVLFGPDKVPSRATLISLHQFRQSFTVPPLILILDSFSGSLWDRYGPPQSIPTVSDYDPTWGPQLEWGPESYHPGNVRGKWLPRSFFGVVWRVRSGRDLGPDLFLLRSLVSGDRPSWGSGPTKGEETTCGCKRLLTGPGQRGHEPRGRGRWPPREDTGLR